MAVAYMPLGTLEELREQIIEVALDRAFLPDPLPHRRGSASSAGIEEGRARLTLIAQEVARLAGAVLAEYAAAARKLQGHAGQPEGGGRRHRSTAAAPDAASASSPPRRGPQLQHLPRYLKAITLRLDKLRADPARDAARLAELRPLEQRYWRRVAERKGAVDDAAATNSAGCSKSCASASSRRSCARRSR